VTVSIVGDWIVTIRTPVGSLHVVYGFQEDAGRITGRAAGKHEVVELTDVAVIDVDGDTQVSWRQTITKPMRLKLEFVVRMDGDRLTGHSRAGRLPRSAVTGVRRETSVPR
jgi:hypothetical protein